MKILVACHRVDEIAGSELYHYELCRELARQGQEVTLATYIPTTSAHAATASYRLVPNLVQEGVCITSLEALRKDEEFDIAVVSQPHVVNILCEIYPNLPKVSIIHSPYRSETLVRHSSIKHYIAVDVFVYRYLKNIEQLSKNSFSLIFNGIDPTKFKTEVNKTSLERVTGLYVGGWNDPLRLRMFEHIVQECVTNDWDLFVVGGTTKGIGYPPNIKFFDGVYNVELFTRAVDFTVGLGGRTLIEGWMCGIPGYVYTVTPDGIITDISLRYPPKVSRFFIENIAKQHISLYKSVYENNI